MYMNVIREANNVLRREHQVRREPRRRALVWLAAPIALGARRGMFIKSLCTEVQRNVTSRTQCDE